MIGMAMSDQDVDMLIRMAAFEHVGRLAEVHDHLTATELKPGFVLAASEFRSSIRNAAFFSNRGR